MALVLYISLDGGKQGSSTNVMSTMVNRELFLLWGLGEDEEEVLNWAMSNTMRLQPPVFCATSFLSMKVKHIPFMVGEDLYLVFTSIYDVHIHPVGGKVIMETMRDCLSGMNQDVNKREELLSKQIYRYNGENGNLVVV